MKNRRAAGLLNLCTIKIREKNRGGEGTTPVTTACPEAGKWMCAKKEKKNGVRITPLPKNERDFRTDDHRYSLITSLSQQSRTKTADSHLVVLGPVSVSVPPSMMNSSSSLSSRIAQSRASLDSVRVVSPERGRERFCNSSHSALP